MEEKFQIDRNKLKRIVETYQSKSKVEKKAMKDYYIELVIDTLGTNILREAISYGVLRSDAINILEGKPINEYYSNGESLRMIEGLSNYEIIGDWQHFRTVEPQYLFKLPRNMQEQFAENFSIGNNDAKECLLSLWENHLETTGTDVIRESSPGSTNNITIQCFAPDMEYIFETLRKSNTSQGYIYDPLY